MKIVFLQRDPFVKLGIATLSAVVKKAGHECHVLVESLEKDMIGSAVSIKPDVITFSITTSEYSWMADVGKRLRARFNGPVICGGSHPTFYPDVVRDEYLDAACVGEGEGAMVDLLAALERGSDIAKIKNIAVRKNGEVIKNEPRPLIDDLDAIPFPDRSIYDKYAFFKRQGQRHVLTSRGCPFQCSFCFNKLYHEIYRDKGVMLRRRSAANVIEELKNLRRENAGLKHIFFLDDTFVLSRDWTDAFLASYKKEIGLPFSCTARANLVTDDLIRKMKGAGCFSIRLGVESGDDEIRNKVLKKGVSYAQIIAATSIIKKHGLRLLLYNIVGSPGETLSLSIKTFELNKKIHPTYAWCSLLQPYPGTEIYDYASSNGYLTEGHSFGDADNSYFMTSPIKMADKRSMHNLQKIFALCVALRLPSKIVRFLIGLPLDRFYEMLFQANYALGISRMDNIGLAQLARTAALSRSYFKKRLKAVDMASGAVRINNG